MQKAKPFWDNVKILPEPACWEWTGYKDKDGYGRLTVNRKDLRAHRVAWELHHGKSIPPGLQLLHKCDNPSCVNPAHLIPGTSIDNVHDSIRKGRAYQSRLAKRTHCKNGHEFTPENTYMVLGTKRRCRICSAETAARFRERLHE